MLLGLTLMNGNHPGVTGAVVGPKNTIAPVLTGTAEVGETLSCSTGTWTGNTTISYTRQWFSGSSPVGADSATYTLVAGDDMQSVHCQVTATCLDGFAVAISNNVAITYPQPVFSVQPTLSPASGTPGQQFVLAGGIASNATLSVETFTLGGFDKAVDLAGFDWDSTGEVGGAILFRMRATNSGGTVFSDLISGTLLGSELVNPTVSSASYAVGAKSLNLSIVEVGSLPLRVFWCGVANPSTPSAAQIRVGTGGGILEAGNYLAGDGTNSNSIFVSDETIDEFHVVATDGSGNNSAIAVVTGVIVDSAAPTLVSSAPADGASMVGVGTDIVLTFDQAVVLATGSIVLYDVDRGSIIETFDAATGLGDNGGTVAISGGDVAINPGANLPALTNCAIRSIATSAIEDTSGNAFPGWSNNNITLNFITVTAGGGSSATFVGDAINNAYSATQIFNSGSTGNTVLPGSYVAGSYAVIVASRAVLPVSVALDGNALMQSEAAHSPLQDISLWIGSVAGGGSGDIVVSLPSADFCAVAVIDLGGLGKAGGTAYGRQMSGTADFPINNDGAAPMSTTPGDLVVAGVLSVDSAKTSAWTGLTEIVPPVAVGNRTFAVAWNLSVAGGAPEPLSKTLTATYKWTSAVSARFN